MRGSYYNEIDPFAAEMLRNLIAAGHIAPGGGRTGFTRTGRRMPPWH